MEWIEHALAIDPDDNTARYNAACTYVQIGELDRAFDVLELWIDNAGWDQKAWLKVDGDLDPIRDHPRYADLLSRIDAIRPPLATA